MRWLGGSSPLRRSMLSVLLASLCLPLSLPAAKAATLAVTAPVNGATLESQTVTLQASASGYAPGTVYFYTGDPNGFDFYWQYLGSASPAADGTYSLIHNFGSDGSFEVFVTDGGPVKSPGVSFTISTSIPNAALAMTAPGNGSTIPANTFDLQAVSSPASWAPPGVTFYVGNPYGPDFYWQALGTANRAADGTYTKTGASLQNGQYSIFAAAANGATRVVSPPITVTIAGAPPPPVLTIVAPRSFDTLAWTNVSLSAETQNFQPASVSFYQGDPAHGVSGVLLGSAGMANTSYTLTHVFPGDGTYTVYATAQSGTQTVTSATVTFTIALPPALDSLALSAGDATSCGAGLTGTVHLTKAATGAGLTVTLASNSPAASVPPSVLVPGGQMTATFDITVLPVHAPTPVTISASYSTVTKTAALTVNPYPRAAYTVEDLGTLGGATSEAAGINRLGQVAGVSGTASGALHGFATDTNGVLRDIAPESAVSVRATAISDTGQVAGSTEDATGARTAFRTDPASGALIALDTLGGSDTRAYAINGAGEVVGEGQDASGAVVAFRSEATETAIHSMGVRDGIASHARGINDAGQVVGWYTSVVNGANVDHGFRTTAGGALDTADLLGDGVYPNAINAVGTVTGEMRVAGDANTHLFVTRSDGSVADLGTLGSYNTVGADIDAAGDVAGYTYSVDGTTGSETPYHAFLCTAAGGVQDLNLGIDAASGWTLVEATGINDRGQIVGYGLHNGTEHAFRLTPNGAPFPYGDANDDGTVDAQDVLTLVRAAAGLQPIPNLLAGDVAPAPLCTSRGFGDGEIDIGDAARLLRHLSGLEPFWP